MVKYREDDIVVTRPGTAFSARYHRLRSSLLLSAATAEASAKPVMIFQFQVAAFDAAMNKARELGWIV